jgi:hypothetical protein
MCAELADLAMQLARAAAARALADQAEPEQPPAAEPPSKPAAEPPSTQTAAPLPHPEAPVPQAAPLPARETARRATATPRNAVHVTSYRPTDPALLFTRLAAVVRDCIMLEARLAGGLAPPRASTTRASSDRAHPRPADPRRGLLREILTRATVNHPDRASLNRQIAARVEEHLQADPDQTLHPVEILEYIREEFQVEADWANLPDEYLDAICEGLEDPGEETPDPRATSPP